MKPNFALNITDTAISLLHRTSRGWLEVGSANFDAPDLEEALGYLRSSALGLSPHGITTKLILPPGQILYTEVEVTGADKAAREVEIRAALEGRTPYEVDDLVFDWRGTGSVVKVAVVARETLDEAEAFAEAHRFNPVSFVTLPAEGQFAGEPWFGMANGAAAILPEGEKVTRDQDPVVIITREAPKAESKASKAAETPKAEPVVTPDESAADDAAKSEAAAADAAKAAAEAEAADAAEKAKAAEKEAADAAKAEADKAEADKAEADKAEAEAKAAEKAAEQERAEREKAEAETLAAATRNEAEAKARAEADAEAEALRKTEAARAEMERRAQELAQAEAKRLVEEAEKTKAAMLEREKTKAALIEAEAKRAASEAAAGEKTAAAFGGVTDPGIAETAETAPAAAASFASRRRDEAPKAPSIGPATGATAPAPAGQGTQSPKITSAVVGPGTGLGNEPAPAPEAKIERPAGNPKGPAAPTITSIAARGPAATAPSGPKPIGTAPAQTTGPVGAPPKPLNGTAAFATGAKAEIAKPADAPANGTAAAKGMAAMVTAAKIPGTSLALSRFKSKIKPAAQASASAAKAGGKADAAMGKFGAKMAPRRGKPRFLGLILTLILLALLAGVAAWSSIYLSRDDTAPQAVQQADATVPASAVPAPAVPVPAVPAPAVPETTVSDADAQASAEAKLPPVQDVAVAAPQDAVVPTAPDTVAGDSAAQSGTAPRAAEDEIMLAAIDPAQPAFDPVALPRPQTRLDAAPAAVSPPPPFGTQYEFEPDGTIKATANGVVMPDGFWLIAARPPVVPPARPAAISDPVAPVAPDANAAATPPPDAATADPAGASTAGISRMEGTVTENTAEEGTVSATGPSFAFEQDATVENRRPRVRPASLDAAAPPTAQDDAAVAPDAVVVDPALARLASLRPRVRPKAVVVAAEEARKAAEAASLAATAAAAEKTRQDSALTVALSPRPAARPRDFSRAVEAAIAAATREAPSRVAAAAAAPAPKAAAPADIEEEHEPELKVSAAPRIPTQANVAKQATFKSAINLSKTNLIGVYGSDKKRYALIRSSSGRYSKVRVGDRVDGGTVAAITRNEVRYQKGGKMLSLSMPKG